MAKDKMINVMVDGRKHRKFKRRLKQKPQESERRIKYVLGDVVNDFMDKFK